MRLQRYLKKKVKDKEEIEKSKEDAKDDLYKDHVKYQKSFGFIQVRQS
jgi:hypothetical protein